MEISTEVVMTRLQWGSISGEQIHYLVANGSTTGLTISGQAFRVVRRAGKATIQKLSPKWQALTEDGQSLGRFHTLKTAEKAAERYYRERSKATNPQEGRQHEQNGTVPNPDNPVSEYQKVVDAAVLDFNTPGMDFSPHDEVRKYIPTSNYHDAYTITYHTMYWAGKPPEKLRRSRGHSWKFELRGSEFTVWVDDPRDHRNGVRGFHAQEQRLNRNPEKEEVKPWMMGYRVQLHPGTDAWMRGDRYGEVVKLGKRYLHVKMDKSGRTLRVPPELVTWEERAVRNPDFKPGDAVVIDADMRWPGTRSETWYVMTDAKRAEYAAWPGSGGPENIKNLVVISKLSPDHPAPFHEGASAILPFRLTKAS